MFALNKRKMFVSLDCCLTGEMKQSQTISHYDNPVNTLTSSLFPSSYLDPRPPLTESQSTIQKLVDLLI